MLPGVNLLHARVLVVDDEVAVRDMLTYGLGKAGFEVQIASDARTALDAAQAERLDAIILDVMLPEIDGFSVLPALRRITDVPIIMLSAKTAIADKVLGLSRGADDYVIKPFDLDELIARIRSALRRPRLEIRETLRYADLMIDVGNRLVFRGERKIDLSKREFALLATFMREPGRVFTRSQLLDLVWGVDREVVLNVVETYISYLRSKIDDCEKMKLLRTVRGSGYVLQSEEIA
jgi:DNA-binding response OmpR family regulator